MKAIGPSNHGCICRYASAMGPTKLVQLSGYTKNIQHEQACPKSPMTHFHDPDDRHDDHDDRYSIVQWQTKATDCIIK